MIHLEHSNDERNNDRSNRDLHPEYKGKFCMIEHVPARVCQETGESFFAPETVEHIQSAIKGNARPVRTVETPIFEYA